jgi:hypothetical protein
MWKKVMTTMMRMQRKTTQAGPVGINERIQELREVSTE